MSCLTYSQVPYSEAGANDRLTRQTTAVGQHTGMENEIVAQHFCFTSEYVDVQFAKVLRCLPRRQPPPAILSYE